MAEVDVKQKILAANQAAAASIRDGYRDSGTLVLNLISSPGSGKTTLLEVTVRALKERFRLAAIEGDIATEKDADRLRAFGVPAHQILTGGACHLDARQVQQALETVGEPLRACDILFIENVGNLICPTSYDLGEDYKVALLSVVEGDDKPFKYPAIFSRAAVSVITKLDLLPYVNFDLPAVRKQIQTLNPTGQLLELSARTGEGMNSWYQLLEEGVARKKSQGSPAGR